MNIHNPQNPSLLQTSSNSNSRSIRERLDRYREQTTGITQFERDRLIPALALRSYHLPGNGDSWWADWFQYFANNHPIFGICCHHRLHPLRMQLRLVNLAGSVAFGLAATNIMWLWFIFDHRTYENTSVVTITSTDHAQRVRITKGMIILWTAGGGLHALFDSAVWYLSACNCCHALPMRESVERAQKYQKYGNYVVLCAVVICIAVATFVVFLRAALEEARNEQESQTMVPTIPVDISNTTILYSVGNTTSDDGLHFQLPMHRDAYTFLISYSVELVLAYLVYYPLVCTMLFSGMLGCMGIGRPSELRQEERYVQQQSCRTFP